MMLSVSGEYAIAAMMYLLVVAVVVVVCAHQAGVRRGRMLPLPTLFPFLAVQRGGGAAVGGKVKNGEGGSGQDGRTGYAYIYISVPHAQLKTPRALFRPSADSPLRRKIFRRSKNFQEKFDVDSKFMLLSSRTREEEAT